VPLEEVTVLLLGDDAAVEELEVANDVVEELELDVGSQRQSSTTLVVDVVTANVLVNGPLQVTVTS